MKTTTFFTFVFLSLSLGTFAQLTPTLDDIWIPTRDTQNLQADVYIPLGVDSAEVILIQTPYNKDNFIWSLPMGVGQNLNGQPYIWVIADWRGFYGSAGAINGQVNRGEDAYDICEWITQQTWHKDRIGTWGPSALGGIQYQLAREQHPNHTCAVPMVAHAHQSYDAYFYGGVLEKARLEQLDALGYGLSPIILSYPYYNFIWTSSENSTWYAPDIQIPTLQIGGWYDHNIDKMVDFYEDSRLSSGAAVQNQQWLLIGPWVHGGTGAAYVGTAIQGELNYPNAEFKSDSMAWDFLNYYLLDASNGWQNTDFITYYETGKNQWATSNATSIAVANTDILYLDYLSLSPVNGTGSSTFISDPSNPSPTIGGATLHTSLDQGPYDQSSLDTRSDITTFSSGVLSNDVSISGRVKVNLHVSADQPDCDIAVRMVDVYPTGESMLITDGIKRMRFRNGYTTADEAFMTVGNVYNLEVELPFMNYTWLSGHRLKIYVSGNSSYRWDVNLQNGTTMYTAGDTNIANIEIHHDVTYPSYIEFPGNNTVLGSLTDEHLDLEIYPNPSTELVHINSNVQFESFEIFSLEGTLLHSGKNTEIISIKNLTSGVYHLVLNHEGQQVIRKLVKP